MDQRTRMQRKRMARKRRNTAILLMFLIIAVLAVVAVIVSVKTKGNKVPKQGQEEQIANKEDTKTIEPDKVEEKPETLTVTFTKEQKYTGDLILVNGEWEYHFDANESTVDLVSIDSAKTGDYQVNKSDMQLASRIIQPLDEMIADCNTALGVSDTGVASAFRSKEYQQQVYDEYVQSRGEEYAKAYVATPGYSEHHTGLALDMGIYYADGSEGSFSESNNATWIAENCYKYGFVRRYQESKQEITKINNEAWHFRYVGIPHATLMEQMNLCLEEYIDYLRENTSVDNPKTVDCEGISYKIYYTADDTIPKPEGAYKVSGNNVDGYIITEEI